MGQNTSIDRQAITLSDIYDKRNLTKVDIDDRVICGTKGFKSNVKGWKFSNTDQGEWVDFREFQKWNADCCYVILHIERCDYVVGEEPEKKVTMNQSSLYKSAVSVSETFTPRGLEHKFSVLESDIFRISSMDDSSFHYDLYIWHGRQSSSSTQATIITKSLEIERCLLNSEVVKDLFFSGDPILSTDYFDDDIQMYRSNPTSSGYLNIFQRFHLFRSLMGINSQISSSPPVIPQLFEKVDLPPNEISLSEMTDSESLLSSSYTESPMNSSRSGSANPKKLINMKHLQIDDMDEDLPSARSSVASTPRSTKGLDFDIPKLETGKLSLDLDNVSRHFDMKPFPTPRNSVRNDTMNTGMLSGAELVMRFRKILSVVYKDFIYVGSDRVAQSKNQLQEEGITHIVNTANAVCSVYFPEDFEYFTLSLYDSGSESIVGIFFEIIDFIEKARESDGKIFIHCHEGVSRSSTLAIAYIMWKTGESFTNVLEDVKKLRGSISPNAGFIVQLLQWEKILKKKSVCLYRVAPLNNKYSEHKEVVAKLCNCNKLDSRTSFVLHHTPSETIYIWHGIDSDFRNKARKFAAMISQYFAKGEIVEIEESSQKKSEEFSKALHDVEFFGKVSTGEDPYTDLQLLNQTNSSNRREDTDSDSEDGGNEEAIPKAYLYEYPDFEKIENFDSEDLFEQSLFVLKPETNDEIFIWIGSGFKEQANYKEIGEEFLTNICKEDPQNYVIHLVHEGDEDNTNFFDYFAWG